MTFLLALALILCGLLVRRICQLALERDDYRRSARDLATELKQIRTRNVVLQRELTDARWLVDGDFNQLVKAQR